MIEIKIKDMIDDAGAILPVDGLSPNATEKEGSEFFAMPC